MRGKGERQTRREGKTWGGKQMEDQGEGIILNEGGLRGKECKGMRQQGGNEMMRGYRGSGGGGGGKEL